MSYHISPLGIKNLSIILALLCLIHLDTIAQPTIQWEENYGGNDSEDIIKIIPTNDLGYLVIGNSESYDQQVEEPCTGIGNSGSNAWILKLTSSNGEISWKETVGGSSFDRVYDGIVVSDGYIFSGLTNSMDCDINTPNLEGTSDNGWIFKLNQSGLLQWSYAYDFNSGYNRFNTVLSTSDGGIVSAGYGYVNGNKTAWLVRMNSFGIQQWQKQNDTEFWGKEIFKLKETSDGGFLGVGVGDDTLVYNGEVLLNDLWLFKMDAQFNIIWSKQHSWEGHSCDNVFKDILINEDNSFTLVGNTSLCNPSSLNNNWIENFDANGNSLSLINIPIELEAVFFDDTGYVGTSGYSPNVCKNKGFLDYFIYKFDSNWKILWYESYGGSYFDIPRTINLLPDGTYILGGSSGSADGDVGGHFGDNFEGDYWIVKLSSYSQEYCEILPTHDDDNPDYNIGIDEININNTNYYTASSQHPAYQDFTNTVITIEPGSVLQANLKGGAFGYPFGSVGGIWAVWIDFNGDGDFEDAGEETTVSTTEYEVNINVPIPANATIGMQTRMRIAVFQPNEDPNEIYPCNMFCFFGEAQDYTLEFNLIPLLSCEGDSYSCNWFAKRTTTGYSEVSNYQCSTRSTPGEESVFVYYSATAGEIATVELSCLDKDLDLFLLDDCNEKTSVLACSQTNGLGKETINFVTEADVTYYFVVDGFENVETEFYLSLTCEDSDDCYPGNTNQTHNVKNISIGCLSFENSDNLVSYNDFSDDFRLYGEAGEVLPLSIATECYNVFFNCNTPAVANYVRIYLDINQDGDFQDPGEVLLNNSWLNAYNYNSNLLLPANLPQGDYDMRVQVINLEDQVAPPVEDCLFWFGGGGIFDFELRVGAENDPYCLSVGCTTCPTDNELTYINSVQFGNEQNVSGSDGGYGDYSNKSYKVDDNGMININIDFSSCTNYNSWYRIWIDANNNGNFGNFGELIHNGVANTYNFSPFGLSPGAYRLRIQAYSYNNQTPSVNPCAQDFLGETEDYTIIVCENINNCELLPIAGFTSNVREGEAPLTVNFSYENPESGNLVTNNTKSSSALSYQWSFPGGIPSSSTSPNPTIVYNSEGSFNVQLTVTNSAGSDTKKILNYITTKANTCPTVVNVNDNPITANTYQASNRITSTGKVNAYTSVTFKAGNVIILGTGFHARKNSNFTAHIENCNASLLTNESDADEISTETTTRLGATEHIDRLESYDLKVFPNPSTHEAVISYNLVRDTEVSIVLYDINGKIVDQIITDAFRSNGNSNERYIVSGLENGIYIVAVITRDKIMTDRMLVLR